MLPTNGMQGIRDPRDFQVLRVKGAPFGNPPRPVMTHVPSPDAPLHLL